MDLGQYERARFELAAILRLVGAVAEAGTERARRVRALFEPLAVDQFDLVVVGRFSRGKTSLMNAMMGRDWLPTGVLPLTSVTTAVCYGSRPGAVLHFNHTGLFQDITLPELPAAVTERGNPGNERNIRLAEVQLPAEILRRGFRFVDTPGLGSAIAANTRMAEAALPGADAFVLVTGYDGPLAAEEFALLERIARSGRPVFVVLNKRDGAGPAERAEAEVFVRDAMARVLGPGAGAPFPVSARDALAARLAGNEAGWQASGVPALEAAIAAFLANDGRAAFLRSLLDQVAVLGTAGDGVAERVAGLRATLANGAGPAVAAARGAGLAPLLPPCAVCGAVSGAVFDLLAALQARLGRDAAAEAEFAAGGGLCERHAAQFERLAAPREVCTGFAPVLDRQADRLDALARNGAAEPEAAVASLRPGAASCPACRAAAAAASGAAGSAADSAVCLPHLGLVAAALPTDARAPFLRRQAELFRRLADDMRRFALKQDASRRDIASAEEAAAGLRGLRALCGNPDAGVAGSG